MSQQERAARYSDLFEESHTHGSDCALCPICAAIAVVRKTKPEVLDHLAAAARELIMAAGIMLDEAATAMASEPSEAAYGPDQDHASSASTGKVRRIDIV